MDYDVSSQRSLVAGGERFGAGQRTASGITFWPLDPRPEEIRMDDIAHHLARLCRWGGAVRTYYSVAEHSILLARHFERRGEVDLARWALLHDAAEAYLGDVVRPLKACMPDFRRIEAHLESVIWRRFGLEGELPDAVREADTAILGDERRELFRVPADPGLNRPGETGLGITTWRLLPGAATDAFLTKAGELFPGAF